MSTIPTGYPTDQAQAFAFLGSRKKLSIDDLKILALLELSGESFYLAAADAIDNEQAKSLLMRNGQEERGHAHRLLKAISLLGGEFELPSNENNPYVQPMNLEGILNVEILDMIRQGEFDGDLQYQNWADAEENEEVAKLYRLNGREETRHGERVKEVCALL